MNLQFGGALRAIDDDHGVIVKLDVDDVTVQLAARGMELGRWPTSKVNARYHHGREFLLEIEGEPWVFVADDAALFADEGLPLFQVEPEPELEATSRPTFGIWAVVGIGLASFTVGAIVGALVWRSYVLPLIGLVALTGIASGVSMAWLLLRFGSHRDPWTVPPGDHPSLLDRLLRLVGLRRTTSARQLKAAIADLQSGQGKAEGLTFQWRTNDEGLSVLTDFLPPDFQTAHAEEDTEESDSHGLPVEPEGSLQPMDGPEDAEPIEDGDRSGETFESGDQEDLDDLTKIRGIGPALEQALRQMGYATYREIAMFDTEDIQRVENNLGRFAGRIRRDNWMASAARLHFEKYGEYP